MYEKYLPPHLREKYLEARSDPNLLGPEIVIQRLESEKQKLLDSRDKDDSDEAETQKQIAEIEALLKELRKTES
jgi:hypothetical protein